MDSNINVKNEKGRRKPSLLSDHTGGDSILQTNIVIIGPIGVGKTTVSSSLAERLNVCSVHLDDLRKKYYAELSFDAKKSNELMQKSIYDWYNYQKPFELYSVKRVMEDYPHGIIDFGGGQSVYDNKEQFEQLKVCVKDAKIFLLMPYSDIEKSAEFLSARCAMQLEKEEPDMPDMQKRVIVHNMCLLNDIFFRSPCNYEIASHIIYIADKNCGQICDEIINIVNGLEN